ncbi:MAG: asparaginase [Bacteroidota bacterium]
MQNPILVEVYRANVLESFHRGTVCVVDENNQVIFSKGDVTQVCYPRSAMKFIQVLPLIVLGGIEKFGFTLEEIAIMCGSHNAEQEHLRVVESILSKIGLSKNELFCGPQYPSSKRDADQLIKDNKKPEHIHNNCSGKHAGMLALCQLLNVPTTDYINPAHPIQQLILEYVEKLYEYPKQKMITALDGCSAPIYAMPVINQAIAFKNLVHNNYETKLAHACKIVIEAVSKYPFMVAGSKRYCTDLMQICAPQIIGKTGAEGIFCISLPQQKIGVCIKIDDGKMLPQYNVAQAFVEATGLFDQETLKPLHHYLQNDLTNFNKFTTGEIKAVDGLFGGLTIQ